MEAGSSVELLKQHTLVDTRSPEEVSAALTERGFDVVWKDWDPAMREDALTR